MSKDDLGPRPGWYVDPLGPLGRRRWWSDEGWTARVAGPEEQADGVAWRPDLADAPPPPVAPPMPAAPAVATPMPAAPAVATPMPPAPETRRSRVGSLTPIRWYAPGYEPPVVAPPALPPLPVVVRDEFRSGVDDEQPVPIAPVLELPAPAEARRERTSRRRTLGAVLVAAALLAAVAAGAGAAIFGTGGRPELAPITLYRDADAGFTLQYPDTWKVDTDTAGRSIRFVVAANGADDFSKNHVSVVVTSGAVELPTLDQLVIDAGAKLRAEFPAIHLETADNTQLAGAPALELNFVDDSNATPIRVRMIAGALASGRQLAVTVTVREPRTAPTPSEFQAFLDSITSL